MYNKELDFKSGSVFLVTGGAGFIGSNLCEAILSMGLNVRCLDDFSTGKMENIQDMLNNNRFTLIEGDITDFNICMEACKGVDFVLNQAALGSVPISIEQPIEYSETNILGTLNMMEAAQRNKVCKFVYASSSAVYGETGYGLQVEGNEGRVLSPYALTKKVCEEYGEIYSSLYSLDTYGLRYFNVFGERQDPEGTYAAVIPKFITSLLKNDDITINGDGMQTRDFTYIENVIAANLLACKASTEFAGKVFNIAYGQKKTILDIYYTICESLKITKNPKFGHRRIGDIKESGADISKARLYLGYEPQVSFEQGIERTIAWYKNNM